MAISASVTRAQQSPSIEIYDPPAIQDHLNHSDIASGRVRADRAIAAGRRLFQTKFNQLDGAGRPASTGDSKPTSRKAVAGASAVSRAAGPDANSCLGCHNDPSIGGSGDFVANVFVGAHFSDPPTSSLDIATTNERNTTTIFGAGLIELIAAEMSRDLKRSRDVAISAALGSGEPVTADLKSKGVGFGSVVARPDGTVDFASLKGVDYDLTVRPFGIRGVAGSLREFTIAALNQHHGIQAVERFGWERTGTSDFDGDGVPDEFSLGQVTALVMFQAALPPPSSAWVDRLRKDKASQLAYRSFLETGCANCHRPLVQLDGRRFSEPNEFNRPGTLSTRDTREIVSWPIPTSYLVVEDTKRYVAMFSDLRRHVMCDREVNTLCNETRKQDNVPLDQFVTARLWNLSTSAPYCHRGDCLTLTEAIVRHGGEARESRDAFIALSPIEKRRLIAFLLRLGN